MFETDTDMIRAAYNFARAVHAKKRRKFTKELYHVHPISVAALVSNVNKDESVICAAILHDVIEDSWIETQTIRTLFNNHVANLVAEVTNRARASDGNREVQFKLNFDHLKNASSEAQTIKLADIIDNTKSVALFDPTYAEIYMAEKKQMLDILTEGDSHLYDMANIIMDNYYRFMSNESKEGGKLI